MPWYRRVWVITSALGTALVAVLTTGPTLLTNAENLNKESVRIFKQINAWYSDDSAWAGVWSTYPEGIVDIEDMKLSTTDLRLHLVADSGKLSGEITSKLICQTVPTLDYLLLEGTTSGDTATLTAFDFLGGHRRDFFRFKAKREGVILEITLIDGLPDWIPGGARVGLHPSEEKDDSEQTPIGYCAIERADYIRKLRSKK